MSIHFSEQYSYFECIVSNVETFSGDLSKVIVSRAKHLRGEEPLPCTLSLPFLKASSRILPGVPTPFTILSPIPFKEAPAWPSANV